ncbi:MAG TPA: hypothetical protein DCL44_12070 [Elusimicrobia bacterium]|nr:hypothetical protein [Elusimicrobiota bacterium]
MSTFLMIDDEPDMRAALRLFLKAKGHELLEAGNGGEALDILKKQRPDGVLLDLFLGKESGMPLLSKIKKADSYLPIVVVTGHADIPTAVEAIKFGAADYITKPFKNEHLLMTLEKAVKFQELSMEVETLKSRFVSMSSHDLANSLTMLQVSFEELRDTIVPDENQKKQILFIATGIGQLSRLISDLADWASIEQGKFHLEKDCFEIARMAEEIIIGPKAKAARHNIGLTTQIEAKLATVYADKHRIGQVFLNLLENAIRHTPRGGHIIVSVSRRAGGELHVAVKDTGEGIAPRDVPMLFRSFYQAKGSKLPHGRLGLGLSIAKEIIAGHGGKIWVESEGPGKGAIFQFTLPLSQKTKAGQKLVKSCGDTVHKRPAIRQEETPVVDR